MDQPTSHRPLRRGPRPRHANPSLLAPSRSTAVLGGLALIVGLAVAGCAVSLHGTPLGRAAAAPVGPRAVRLDAAAADGTTSAPPEVGAVGAVWFRPRAGGTPTTSSPDSGGGGAASGLAADGIPTTALLAYRRAAVREARRNPGCGLTWPLLAGIGRVESDHGRFAGAVLHADGVSTPRIVGIPLDGNGTAAIRDTDHGRLDGDPVWDRAVGPMQFIPSTWAGWGVDANGDGVKDPNNLYDAAAAAADYLCAAGRDLRVYAGQVAAVRSYNDSDQYIAMVLGLERTYARGVETVPTAPGHGRPGPLAPPGRRLPPVDPGRPPAVPPVSGPPVTGRPVTGVPTVPDPPGPTSTPPASNPPTEPSSGSSAPPDPASPTCPETTGSTVPPLTGSVSSAGPSTTTDEASAPSTPSPSAAICPAPGAGSADPSSSPTSSTVPTAPGP